MARYRLAVPAKADIQSILRTSEFRHGAEAVCSQRRCAGFPEIPLEL